MRKMNKTKIELSLVLPGVPDARDQCVQRISEQLRTKAGIDEAHVAEPDDGHPDRLCIHFDPSAISLAEVRELTKRTGAKLDERYGHVVRRIESMHARRASAIESRLVRVSGVLEAVVSPDGVVRVEYDRHVTDESKINNALQEWSRLEEQMPEDQFKEILSEFDPPPGLLKQGR
jgi:Cd2+/Zn2+-exporting ATPase